MNAAPRPALVLVHGATLNRHMWGPISVDLAPDFTVTTPDLPGHGTRSDVPFTLGGAVEDLSRVVATVGSSRVVLVGDSLGSYLSLAAASAIGPTVIGAFLAGCTANFQGPARFVYQLEAGLVRLLPATRVKARLDVRIARDYIAGHEIVKGGIRPEAYFEAVDELRRFDARAAFARLSIPIVLVNGARDWRHRITERSFLAAGRNATLEHVAGVGHGVTLTRPGVFTTMLRRFVARITQTT